jgi:predicted RNA-binding Zn-ribbon protein involved in translation (DUF1610 family)
VEGDENARRHEGGHDGGRSSSALSLSGTGTAKCAPLAPVVSFVGVILLVVAAHRALVKIDATVRLLGSMSRHLRKPVTAAAVGLVLGVESGADVTNCPGCGGAAIGKCGSNKSFLGRSVRFCGRNVYGAAR